MSKFVVARALKDTRITEVDYRKKENQHEGKNINFHNVIKFDSSIACRWENSGRHSHSPDPF